MEDKEELVCDLSNDVISYNLERPPSPDFKVTPVLDVEYGINGTRETHV